MVVDRLSDGGRVAQLLASEVTGGVGSLREARVVDADPDVEPSADGAVAYAVAVGDVRVATAAVQPDRVRLEVRRGREAAARTAEAGGLRVRRHPGPPPRTLVFVPDGAAVKAAADALAAAVESLDGTEGEHDGQKRDGEDPSDDGEEHDGGERDGRDTPDGDGGE